MILELFRTLISAMGRAEDYKGIRHTITFPKEVYEAIQALAKAEDRPYAQMVIRLLKLQLEAMEKNNDNV
jgi:hypothetical protein